MGEKYSTFFQRLFVVILGIPILGYIIFWNEMPFLITIIIFNLLGLYELYNMSHKKENQPSLLFGSIFSLYFIYLAIGNLLSIKLDNILIIILLLIFLISRLFTKNRDIALSSIAVTIFASIYVGYFSSFLLKIKLLPNGNYFLIFLLVIVWVNDIAAYIIGTAIGKLKLAPKISPKKTIEGSIAGIFFSIITIIFLNHWLNYDLNKLIVIGIAVSVFGQCGDLFESMLKRGAKIKDSGNLIPGHGGVLDRFDSLLFAAPVFYFCILYIP